MSVVDTAFLVSVGSDLYAGGGSIMYQDVIFDYGNNYANGIYNAPEDGVYS